jgi:hypothetical protein
MDWMKPCAYDAEQKTAFRRAARNRLKTLAGAMGWSADSYDLRSNLAGIAVSGEITLHHDTVYIQVSQSALGCAHGILIRGCEGRRDYSGGPNHHAPLSLLDDNHPDCRRSFAELEELGRVVFTAPISGALYRRHGTTVDTRLTVIDRVPVAGNPGDVPAHPMADSAEALLDRVAAHVPARPACEDAGVSVASLRPRAEIAVQFAHRWAAIRRMPLEERATAAAALRAEQDAALAARTKHLIAEQQQERQGEGQRRRAYLALWRASLRRRRQARAATALVKTSRPRSAPRRPPTLAQAVPPPASAPA